MRRLAFLLVVVGLGLLLAVSTAVLMYAQEEMEFLGRYDDVHNIPDNYTKETNQFVFARLIYNGRIPGYYKNWYTDYPRADRNLIAVLKRLTNINISEKERAIPLRPCVDITTRSAALCCAHSSIASATMPSHTSALTVYPPSFKSVSMRSK